MERNIKSYSKYFNEFYKEQDKKVRKKTQFVFDLIRYEKVIPAKFFKYLKGTEGLYEIRIKTTYKNIRILCFQDGENLIILLSVFVKKTNKTPIKEIRKAEQLKKRYLEGKQ